MSLVGPHVVIGRDPRRVYVKQRQALHASTHGYACPHCPVVMESPGGLGGHVSWHRRRGDLPERAA